MRNHTRRTILQTGGVLAATGLAGCFGWQNDTTGQTSTDPPPTSERTPTDPPPSGGQRAGGSGETVLGLPLPETGQFVEGSRAQRERGGGTVAIDTGMGRLRFISDSDRETVTVIAGYLAADTFVIPSSWAGTADTESKLIGTNVLSNSAAELSFDPTSFRGIALNAADTVDLVVDGVLVASAASVVRYATERGLFELQRYDPRYDWQHSLSSRGTSGTLTEDTDVPVFAEDIKVDLGTTDSPGTAVFDPGFDVDLALRVLEPATDKSVTIRTTAEPQRYAIRRIDVEVYQPSGEISDEPELYIDQADEPEYEDRRWQTEVTGDRDIFTGDTFSEYAVQVLNGSELVGETGTRIVGIGYETQFTQSGETVRITRDDEVRSDWYVQFRVTSRDPYETVARKEVANEEGTDAFEFTVDDLDVEPGSYPWALDIYEGQDDRVGERLVGLSSFGEDTRVSIS